VSFGGWAARGNIGFKVFLFWLRFSCIPPRSFGILFYILIAWSFGVLEDTGFFYGIFNSIVGTAALRHDTI
jgi:hypothetical protein